MAIDNPVSDLARSNQMDADHSWPHEVRLAVHWVDASGKISIRSEIISANQFFGEGGYGAPLDGSFLVSAIDRMRRLGPPVVARKARARK